MTTAPKIRALLIRTVSVLSRAWATGEPVLDTAGRSHETAATRGKDRAMSDLFDKAKDLLAENSDTVDDVVDKIAGLVDDKTGGKHSDQVRDGAAKAKDVIAGFVGADDEKPEKKPKPKPSDAS